MTTMNTSKKRFIFRKFQKMFLFLGFGILEIESLKDMHASRSYFFLTENNN